MFKETVRSFRLYFVFVGLVSLYSTGLFGFVSGTKSVVAVSFGALAPNVGLSVTLIVGVVFLYFAYTLPTYLRSDKVWVLKSFIIISAVTSITVNVANDISEAGSFGLGVVFLLLELVVLWYIYQNIDRLSKESA